MLSCLGVRKLSQSSVVFVARWLTWLSTWALAHTNKEHTNKGHSIAWGPEAPLAHLSSHKYYRLLKSPQKEVISKTSRDYVLLRAEAMTPLPSHLSCFFTISRAGSPHLFHQDP